MVMADNKIVVEIKNLSKAFGEHIVLDDISLQVEDGENLVVFGRSGTGKSVLLKCMIRLMEADTGRVIIHGKDVIDLSFNQLNELRKDIGFLFQGAALYDSMSVKENLEFPLIRHFDFTQKERDEKVNEILQKVQLEEALNKMPSELSGGMKKRIGLARAVISEPKLMLYDEPTTGLDPITSKEISKLILELQKEFKMTSVIVTHDLLCAEIIADRAIMLEKGKIQFEGTIDDMIKSEDKFLKNFFSNEIIESNNNA